MGAFFLVFDEIGESLSPLAFALPLDLADLGGCELLEFWPSLRDSAATESAAAVGSIVPESILRDCWNISAEKGE